MKPPVSDPRGGSRWISRRLRGAADRNSTSSGPPGPDGDGKGRRTSPRPVRRFGLLHRNAVRGQVVDPCHQVGATCDLRTTPPQQGTAYGAQRSAPGSRVIGSNDCAPPCTGMAEDWFFENGGATSAPRPILLARQGRVRSCEGIVHSPSGSPVRRVQPRASIARATFARSSSTSAGPSVRSKDPNTRENARLRFPRGSRSPS